MGKLKEFRALAGIKINNQKMKMLTKNTKWLIKELMKKMGLRLRKNIIFGYYGDKYELHIIQNNYVKTWNELKKTCSDG